MRHLSFLLLSLNLLLSAAPAFSQDAPAVGETAIPALKSRVTDLTGTLGSEQQRSLEAKLAAFEQRKGSQLALLIVATTGNETIEQFAIRAAEQWKLGRKGTDDGLLLIVAKADRTLRIEVGYGLEGVIPDAIAKRVISETIVPRFKAGDFASGIDAGMTQLMALVDGEALPPPTHQKQRHQRQEGNNPLGLLLMAAMVGGQVLRSLLGPVVAGGVVGAGVFGVAWLITGTLGMALVLGFGGFFVTLLGIMGLIGSSGFGGGGRGGFGGMGGGGFGGGGGGFGGGGASGRW
ncbi:MAG: TPM domain-containing protein [Pseudomonadota bacterium]